MCRLPARDQTAQDYHVQAGSPHYETMQVWQPALRTRRSLMRKLRVLVLMHESLVPPASLEGHTEQEILEWKTEFDVVNTLTELGHEVLPLGVYDDLGDLRRSKDEFQTTHRVQSAGRVPRRRRLRSSRRQLSRVAEAALHGVQPPRSAAGTRQTAGQKDSVVASYPHAWLLCRPSRKKNTDAGGDGVSVAGEIVIGGCIAGDQ